MRKYGFVISAMLLTAVPVGADARKPFIGICEGIVQLGFFIDDKVSAPVGRAQREKSIGRYTCTFSDPEISTICPKGSTCRVMALMISWKPVSDSEGVRGRQSEQTLDNERVNALLASAEPTYATRCAGTRRRFKTMPSDAPPLSQALNDGTVDDLS